MLRNAARTLAKASTSSVSAAKPSMKANSALGACSRRRASFPVPSPSSLSASSACKAFSTCQVTRHGGKGRPKEGEGVTLHFKKASGEVETVQANIGDDIVDVSWEYDLDIEAACEKSIACSTCHVILEPDVYDLLPEPGDDENDMLDLAFGLEDTSRLGCQVHVCKEMDGTTIRLPSATRNMRVDGSKPTPH